LKSLGKDKHSMMPTDDADVFENQQSTIENQNATKIQNTAFDSVEMVLRVRWSGWCCACAGRGGATRALVGDGV
jgi:hypothetical protein